MPSQSQKMLKANKDDLDRLMEFHEQEAGAYPGRKRYVEVLNKSAVVLVCAAWEAYCEDIVEEAIEHLVDDCDDCNKLPNILKTTVAKRVREDAHDHAPWNLAGNGWKTEIKTSASGVVDKLTGRWKYTQDSSSCRIIREGSGNPRHCVILGVAQELQVRYHHEVGQLCDLAWRDCPPSEHKGLREKERRN